jgi:hypothetical protein
MANGKDRATSGLRVPPGVVGRLREFHRIGRRSLEREPGKGTRGTVARHAAEYRLNPDTMLKARKFADPVSGYSPAELEELCRACKGRNFGVTYVIRLLSVPKDGGQRAALQRAVLENDWSTSRLDAEIARRFGRRGRGGRLPSAAKSLADPTRLLVHLETHCETWRRLASRLSPAPGGAGGRASEAALPPAVRRRYREAVEAVALLQAALRRALDTTALPDKD